MKNQEIWFLKAQDRFLEAITNKIEKDDFPVKNSK